jgi:hypothetical protein
MTVMRVWNQWIEEGCEERRAANVSCNMTTSQDECYLIRIA